MTEEFRPELITKDIVYCLLQECPQAATCLRYLAYQHSAPFFAHSFVDPRRLAESKQCPDYLSNQVQRSARGFKRAMGLIAKNSVSTFQAYMREELGWGRSSFYRYSAGDHPIYEAQQVIIRRIFSEMGVTIADVFDAYEDAYALPY